MPLVVMCGYPSSGKTRRAHELSDFLQAKYKQQSHIIQDENISEDFDKNNIFADSKLEKMQRGNLKSYIQRYLNKEGVIIADSLNYIKGFRYELYCVVKSARTPHCVILCNANESQAKAFNISRPSSEQYSDTTLNGLMMRFEAPSSEARWDCPLFVVNPEDELPLNEIYDALFLRKPPPPNQSTQSPPLAATSFIHELDKVTQEVVGIIMDMQKTCVAGDQINIPGSDEKLVLTKQLTLPELQRYKRQFISFAKSRAVDSTSKVPVMFVHFLNTSIQ